MTPMRAAFSAQAFMKSAGKGKSSHSEKNAPAREIARRLIESGRPAEKGGDSPAHAAAAASDRLYRELSRWVGRDGCHALFARALAEARTDHPALGKIQLHARAEPYIDGVAETIIAQGDPASAEALESMLVRLVELLDRLIGDDMALKLIERTLAHSNPADWTFDNRREEA
jgi:hypothetical protein